ncbi:MAG: hypothetical protein KBC84_03540 [Proteobacteria bacterium]|nr:hypothetical protein [Pseudomonadota bacterium]
MSGAVAVEKNKNINVPIPKPIPNNSITDASAKEFSSAYTRLSPELDKAQKETITISTKAVRYEGGKHTEFIGGTREERDAQIATFDKLKKEKEWPLVKALFHLADEHMKDKFNIDSIRHVKDGKEVLSTIVRIGSKADNSFQSVKVNTDTGAYQSLK